VVESTLSVGLPLFGSLALAGFFVWLIIAKNRLAEPLLFCTILICSVLAIALELMSVVGAVTLTNIRFALIGAILVCSAITFYFRRHIVRSEQIPAADHLTVGASQLFNRDTLILQRILAASLLFIVLTVTAFVALWSVPNTWDSMTYHLPRIEHWLQNQSLEFYPTSITRQLDFNILAEELILAVRSVGEAYPIANMVQWLSFCGCILVVGGIARELKGTRSAQYLSSVMMATLPMAILQSSSTQNDLVVAFFSVASVYFLLRVRVGQSYCLLYGAILAAALAFHAKGIAAVFLSGFVVVYGGGLVLKAKSPRFWIHALAATVIALLIVGAQLHRNINKFGSAFGPHSRETMTVEPNWRSTLFNAARNLASNAGTSDAIPWVAWMGRALNVEDTDERYSYQGRPFSLPTHALVVPHETDAPNTAHVIVLLLSIIGFSVLALASPKWRGKYCSLARFSLAVGITVVAFCILIKWQPWITRLQLGEFALVIPPAAVLISNLAVIPSSLMLIFGFLAVPAMFHNRSRPIIDLPRWSIISASPNDVLFANWPHLEPGYVGLADKIAELGPKQVGVIIGDRSWEFPLWYLLKQRLRASDMPRIIHELNEHAIDPRSDVVVYIYNDVDTVRHADPDGMVEVPGFYPLRLFQRKR
jgi:4-amino-4-deoxy-L-arabinose transferase-like glycosyltransferase